MFSDAKFSAGSRFSYLASSGSPLVVPPSSRYCILCSKEKKNKDTQVYKLGSSCTEVDDKEDRRGGGLTRSIKSRAGVQRHNRAWRRRDRSWLLLYGGSLLTAIQGPAPSLPLCRKIKVSLLFVSCSKLMLIRPPRRWEGATGLS